jgi:hypothetical protein
VGRWADVVEGDRRRQEPAAGAHEGRASLTTGGGAEKHDSGGGGWPTVARVRIWCVAVVWCVCGQGHGRERVVGVGAATHFLV